MVRLFHARDGSTSVEIAIALPIFFALLFGSIEFARFYWIRNTIQFAVEEAARYAMVSKPTDGEIGARVRERASMLDQPSLSVDVTREAVAGVSYVVIDTRYDWPSNAFSGFFPADLRVATGRARVPLVD